MAKFDSSLGATASFAAPPPSNRIELSRSTLTLLCAIGDFLATVALILTIDIVYHQHIGGIYGTSNGQSAALLVASLLVTFQYLQGAYDLQKCLDTPGQLRRLLLGWCGVFFVIGWVGFLLKVSPDYSRAVLTISFVLGLIGLGALRIATAAILRRGLFKERLALKKAFLICAGDETQRARMVRSAAKNGTEVVSSVSLDPREIGAGEGLGQSVLDAIHTAFEQHPFDEIYLFLPLQQWRPLNDLTIALNHVPLPVYLFAGDDMAAIAKANTVRLGRMAGFEVQRPPLSVVERQLKRWLDIVVAAIALVGLTPLFLLISAAIFVESGGPVVFRQSRKGFGERSFTIYKFRTMKVCENGDTIAQATRNDARVTRVGAILRRTSLDELPQIVNVLKGNMSIVGPRPHAIAHDNHYDTLISTYAYRHHVKPGLTGWAQVHGLRGETRELPAMEDRIRHDIWYINNWSLWLDLQIMVRTAATLPLQRQAY